MPNITKLFFAAKKLEKENMYGVALESYLIFLKLLQEKKINSGTSAVYTAIARVYRTIGMTRLASHYRSLAYQAVVSSNHPNSAKVKMIRTIKKSSMIQGNLVDSN